MSPTSPLIGSFRYEPIAPLVIPAGTYNLGAFYPGNNTTANGYFTGTTGITMSPGFTMLNTLRDPDAAQTGLVFPSVADSPGGRFGPNILWTEVPEPAALGLLAFGAVALLRRRA